MQLDRTKAPKASSIKEINLPNLNRNILDNGNSLFIINAGEQPVIRLEIIFDAGNKYEQKAGQSVFCIKMLAEGTSKLNSFEIAEKFAAIGYFIEFSQGAERAIITLNGLTKHLQKALETLVEVITDPIFPEKELQTLKNITKQSLSINMAKTAYVASLAFKENLFGENHYIGKSLNISDIDLINRDDIFLFFKNNIQSKSFKIFASGKIAESEISIINKVLGNLPAILPASVEDQQQMNNYKGKQLFIKKEGALQSSIRIGRKIIDRNHVDFFNLKVANTILGGYFGSRLMKNIREEKGYTYGISSSHLPIPNYAYMLIGTDVKGEFTQNTIDEIYKEIYKLQNELVTENELEVVKNFIVGDFAGSINTPFDIAEKHKFLVFEQLNHSFFEEYIQNIMKVTNQNISETAIKYFDREEMIEIIVGAK